MTAPQMTLADTARAIVAEPVRTYERDCFIRSSAQAYLDNLSDGYDEPDELLDLLAESDALEEYRGKDWLFDYWLDDHKADYVAGRRVYHGMTGVAA